MPFIRDLLKYIDGVFVETGTYQGGTTDMVNNNIHGVKIRTLELSNVFYHNCKERFKNNSNIEVFHMNSKHDLYNCIKDIDEKITFWLDGHWSDVHNIGCDSETKCPILFELEQLKLHSIKTHTIMVDDIRLMDNIHFSVTKDKVIKKIYEINPNYKIKYYDDECAKEDILVAYIDT